MPEAEGRPAGGRGAAGDDEVPIHDLTDVVVTRLAALAPDARRFAVGVSGGGDSVALAAMLCARGLDVVVLHVDHGLRPDSRDDEAFVRAFAASRGAPFASRSVDVRAATGRRG